MKIMNIQSTKFNSNSPKRNSNSVSFKAVNSNSVKNAFKNGYSVLTDAIAMGEGRLANTRPMQQFVDFMKDKNYQQHIVVGVGTALSGFYIFNTLKAKNIEKEQKMPLALNQGLVHVAASVGGYTLDNYLNKKLDKFTETFNIANLENKDVQKMMLNMYEKKDSLGKKEFNAFFKLVPHGKDKTKLYSYKENITDSFDVDRRVMKQMKNHLKKNPNDTIVKDIYEELKTVPKKADNAFIRKNEIFTSSAKRSPFLRTIFSKQGFKKALKLATEGEKNISTLMTGLKVAKSLLVFGLIYRFVSPVLVTPIANKVSKHIEDKKKAKVLDGKV